MEQTENGNDMVICYTFHQTPVWLVFLENGEQISFNLIL